MRWRKLGQVSDCFDGGEWIKSHAMLPIAEVVSNDVLRIYYSVRNRNNHSVTVCANFKWKNGGLERLDDLKKLLSPGENGFFDDSGAMLCWLVPVEDRVHAYYVGWNIGANVPFRNSLGLAFFYPEGRVEKLSSGPILDRSVFDPCFVAACSVLRINDEWHMWYLSCTEWRTVGSAFLHRYHIKYASSQDGVDWQRAGKVAIDFKSSEEYAISRPCVIHENGLYKMWYSYRGESYRIGYAESLDGLNWERLDHMAGIDVSSDGWDSQMIEYPYVFDWNGQRYMLYNGNSFGLTGFGLAVLE